jgi:hypothetical protein
MKNIKNITLLDAAIKEKNKSIENTFLKEWNDLQIKGIEKAVVKHFSKSPIITSHGGYCLAYRDFNSLASIMGFAYTSTSNYAGYWICNTEVESLLHTGFKYIGFAISSTGKYYAVLWDKDENEILQAI